MPGEAKRSDDPWISVAEAARMLGCGRTRATEVLRMVGGFKDGGRWKIGKAKLLAHKRKVERGGECSFSAERPSEGPTGTATSSAHQEAFEHDVNSPPTSETRDRNHAPQPKQLGGNSKRVNSMVAGWRNAGKVRRSDKRSERSQRPKN